LTSKSLGDVTQNLAILRPISSSAASGRKSLVETMVTIGDKKIEMILESLSLDEPQPVMSLVQRNATFELRDMRWTVETFASETTNCYLQTATGIPIYSATLARLSTSLSLNNLRLSSSNRSPLSFEKEFVMMTMT